jgi:ankyrin repeat protein
MRGKLNLQKALLDREANINAQSNDGKTSIHYAVLNPVANRI